MSRAIDQIRRASLLSGSDHLSIVIDGEIIVSDSNKKITEPIELMSATKSVVALAVAILLQQRTIKSLETPICDYFPEWNVDLKNQVTLRHILNHTSGIKARRTTEDIYDSPNFLQFARSSEMLHRPGQNFFYNNKATQLLSGIVQMASGKRLDQFLAEHLFQPLGISDWTWTLDKSGNPHAFAGLALKGEDLLKIGQLMLGQGLYKGHRIFHEDWTALSFAQGQEFEPTCGLLWWRNSKDTSFGYDSELLEKYKTAGLPDSIWQKIQSAPGKMPFKEFRKQLEMILGSKSEVEEFISFANSNMLISRRLSMEKAEVFSAHGYLGQYLSIIPEKKIIAVRQADYRSVKNQMLAEFPDFRELLIDVAAEV